MVPLYVFHTISFDIVSHPIVTNGTIISWQIYVLMGFPRLNPGMKGTQEMLDSIEKCPTIQCLVLTSSMSACAPTPEPPVKDESHWSDDNAQLSRGNYYGCLSKYLFVAFLCSFDIHQYTHHSLSV